MFFIISLQRHFCLVTHTFWKHSGDLTTKILNSGHIWCDSVSEIGTFFFYSLHLKSASPGKRTHLYHLNIGLVQSMHSRCTWIPWNYVLHFECIRYRSWFTFCMRIFYVATVWKLKSDNSEPEFVSHEKCWMTFSEMYAILEFSFIF